MNCTHLTNDSHMKSCEKEGFALVEIIEQNHTSISILFTVGQNLMMSVGQNLMMSVQHRRCIECCCMHRVSDLLGTGTACQSMASCAANGRVLWLHVTYLQLVYPHSIKFFPP